MTDTAPRSLRTLRLIAVMKWLHAAAMVAIALGLLRSDPHALAAGIAHALRSPLLERALVSAVDAFAALPASTRAIIDAGLFLYAAVFLVEGIGLWRGRRWAEWLTTIVTSLLIPLELYELLHKPTWERLALLVANGLIVAYLVWRLRREHRATDVGV